VGVGDAGVAGAGGTSAVHLRDGRHATHTPAGSAAALAQPARYGWNAEDLNAIVIDWATDSGLVPDPTTPVAFLRWLLKRHDLAFSPTLLEATASSWWYHRVPQRTPTRRRIPYDTSGALYRGLSVTQSTPILLKQG